MAGLGNGRCNRVAPLQAQVELVPAASLIAQGGAWHGSGIYVDAQLHRVTCISFNILFDQLVLS